MGLRIFRAKVDDDSEFCGGLGCFALPREEQAATPPLSELPAEVMGDV